MELKQWCFKPYLYSREIDVGQKTQFKLQQAVVLCAGVTRATLDI